MIAQQDFINVSRRESITPYISLTLLYVKNCPMYWRKNGVADSIFSYTITSKMEPRGTAAFNFETRFVEPRTFCTVPLNYTNPPTFQNSWWRAYMDQ
jgi:hypothetical protein